MMNVFTPRTHNNTYACTYIFAYILNFLSHNLFTFIHNYTYAGTYTFAYILNFWSHSFFPFNCTCAGTYTLHIFGSFFFYSCIHNYTYTFAHILNFWLTFPSCLHADIAIVPHERGGRPEERSNHGRLHHQRDA